VEFRRFHEALNFRAIEIICWNFGYHFAMPNVLKSLTDSADQNSLLAEWHGAKAEVWIFHLTFRRLALLLRLPERSDVLYVVGLGCRHINGPFRWEGADIPISRPAHESSSVAGETMTRVCDRQAQFELICSGGVILIQSSEIVSSFDEFHFPGD
jgi:hypothetical protein